MKKIFLLATALITLGNVSKAAKNDVKAVTTTVDNKNTAPASATTATAVSTADLMKENQQLKQALQQATEEKEVLSNKLDYANSMHSATVSLHDVQLQKQEEETKSQMGFAWMMHNVIMKLTNALNSSK